jgi:hypothetical protein
VWYGPAVVRQFLLSYFPFFIYADALALVAAGSAQGFPFLPFPSHLYLLFFKKNFP